MTIDIASDLFGYLDSLYELNQNIIKLCGNVIQLETSEKTILDVIQNIPRLMPYKFNKKTNILELDIKSGLLEYKDKITYLENEYEQILKSNYDTLDKVRKIRNKFEHKIHGIRILSSGYGSVSMFNIEFEITKNNQDENIKMNVNELIKVVKDLNILFSKLIEDISNLVYGKDLCGHPYFMRIRRFDFKDFNKIYESNLLKEIGKIMHPF